MLRPPVVGHAVNERARPLGPRTDVSPCGAERLYAAACAQGASAAPTVRPAHTGRANVISALSMIFTTLPPLRGGGSLNEYARPTYHDIMVLATYLTNVAVASSRIAATPSASRRSRGARTSPETGTPRAASAALSAAWNG